MARLQRCPWTSAPRQVFPSNAFMALARSFTTLYDIAWAVMQISVPGHLLLRPQKRTGEGPVHSPLGRHHHKPGKQQRHTKQNQTIYKTKQQNQNKPKPDTQEWLAPSSLVIHAGDGSIVSSHPIMAKKARKQTKQKGNKHTQGHTHRWEKQHNTMRKPGIPPARIPEITWRKPNGITTHPLSLRSKQRQRRVATRVVRRKLKHEVKPVLKWERQLWTDSETSRRVRSESAQ